MKNKIVLSLSTEILGVIVGHLYRGNEHLLSSNNPTTIAAAIFALGECEIAFWTKTEAINLQFPIAVGYMCGVQKFIYDKGESDFLWGLAKSSWFDFLNPHPADIRARAEFHLIEAVSCLPERLVRNRPSSSQPKGFTVVLKACERCSPFAPD